LFAEEYEASFWRGKSAGFPWLYDLKHRHGDNLNSAVGGTGTVGEQGTECVANIRSLKQTARPIILES
jgi:hypothetical protein